MSRVISDRDTNYFLTIKVGSEEIARDLHQDILRVLHDSEHEVEIVAARFEDLTGTTGGALFFDSARAIHRTSGVANHDVTSQGGVPQLGHTTVNEGPSEPQGNAARPAVVE